MSIERSGGRSSTQQRQTIESDGLRRARQAAEQARAVAAAGAIATAAAADRATTDRGFQEPQPTSTDDYASSHRERGQGLAGRSGSPTASADRLPTDRAFLGTQSAGAGNAIVHPERGHGLGGGGGGGSWCGAPQRLTERALLLHESRGTAGDILRVVTAAHGPPRRGSRFVPDALPFHCTADYLQVSRPGRPGLAAAKERM